MKIGDLIGLLFLARDTAHMAHLKTTSYAKHMALGDFYSGIEELADDLTEQYQGQFGLIPVARVARTTEPTDANIVSILKDQLAQIQGGRKASVGDDSSLNNVIDEIVGLYRRTIYRLRFLV